jgi:T4 RnlA family RNA ligase
MEWNKPLRLVKEIKHRYIEQTKNETHFIFQDWLDMLDDPAYNAIFNNVKVTQYQHYVLMKYSLIEMYNNFLGFEHADDIYQECRSVVIDLKSEVLVITPFKKFFNLGEVETTSLSNVLSKIEKAHVVEAMDKLDGSMLCARWYQQNLWITSSSQIDATDSWHLKQGIQLMTSTYQAMLQTYADYTFIFEFVGPENRHVVKYDSTQLILTGIRRVHDGYLMHHFETEAVANDFGIPVVKQENLTLDEIIRDVKVYKSQDKEGWVLNIDGERIKIKCDDYVDVHHLLDSLSSTNVIIELIHHEKLDDVLAKLSPVHQNRVLELSQKITAYASEMNARVEKMYALAPKEDRKTFMIWVDKNVEKDIKTYLRNKFLNEAYTPLHTGLKYKKANEMGIDDKKFSVMFGNEN